MSVILLLTAVPQLWRIGDGFPGWCVGFTVGYTLSQKVLGAVLTSQETALLVLGVASVLWIAWLPVQLVVALRRRQV